MRNIWIVCSLVVAAVSPALAQSTELSGVGEAADKVFKKVGADGAGLTVVRSSRELHRSLHGTFQGDQVVPIGSASKWLTVATIMTLVDDGVLELHQPVSRYVEELQREDLSRVTLRQCMTCTSGLPAEMRTWMAGWDMDHFAEEVADASVRTLPGDAFLDGSVGFQVAALAAVRASGQSWHELFRSRIGDRLGMRDTHFGGAQPLATEPGDTELPWVGSGAVSTLNDYTRFVRMLLADGRWHGLQILSKQRVDEILRDQVPSNVDVRAPAGMKSDVRYGLGTWIESKGKDLLRFSHPGAFGFTPWISADRSYGCVFAIEAKGAVVSRQLSRVRKAVAAVITSPEVIGTAEVVKLRHDGRSRRYRLHVPPHDESYDGLPLLIVLHGEDSNGEKARAVTALDRLGVDRGFVVAFPDGSGLVPRRGLTWNCGGSDVYAARKDIDDVGFCKAVVADIQTKVAIDVDRVFVTGHGNGGMMCHRLARQAADVFRGIAPVAAAMNYTEAQSDVPLAVMLIHGTDDEDVRINGGESAAKRGRKARVDASLEAAVDYYVERNDLLAYARAANRDGVSVEKFAKKLGDGEASPIWVVRLEGGGHAWPGAQVRDSAPAVSPYPWPASRAILEFFYSVDTGALQDWLTPSTPR